MPLYTAPGRSRSVLGTAWSAVWPASLLVLLVLAATASPNLAEVGGGALASQAQRNTLQSETAYSEPEAGWRPAEVPNPWEEPAKCGLQRRGWLCDPDGILSGRGRAQVMDVLLAIRSKTRAQCPGGERGYQVGVALVGRMHPSVVHARGKEAAARHFAQDIGDRWGVGDPGCNNGIVVFLSIDDRFAYIKTARTSQNKLTDSLATTVVDNMKPLLRQERYDDAMLQAALQINDALHGERIPGAPGVLDRVQGMLAATVVFAVFGVTLAPALLMCMGGLLTGLLLPFAWCMDALQACLLRRRRGREERAAQRELELVQRELARGEFSQTLCPICLEPLQGPRAPTTLDCRHQFHGACIDPWVQQHGSCPLCRADVQMPVAPEDEDRPAEYQRRLRFYMSRVRHRHPALFEGSSHSTPYYCTRPDSGRWHLLGLPRDGRLSSGASYAQSLQLRYREATRGASSWLSRLSPSSDGRASHGGGSYGGFGGGGGFSYGGGW